MKHYSYFLFFITLLNFFSSSALAGDDVFIFDISKNQQPEPFFASDDYPEEESSYDAVCDRSPIARVPFYQRIITRLYAFWYSNSLYVQSILKEQSIFFRKRTDQLFRKLCNHIKQLRRKIV